MMDFGKTVENFMRTVNETSRNMESDVQKVVDRTGLDVLRIATNGTPVDTGTLKSRWRGRASGRGSEREFDVTNDVTYGTYVEYGTSKMAPRRMLTKAVSRGRMILERRLRQLSMKTSTNFNRS